jgi:hypothetical protein
MARPVKNVEESRIRQRRRRKKRSRLRRERESEEDGGQGKLPCSHRVLRRLLWESKVVFLALLSVARGGSVACES